VSVASDHVYRGSRGVEIRIKMSTPGMTTTAIEAAWREFAGELRTFIGRRVSRPEDADDILQLVALRLTQNAAGDRDRTTLLAWLYRVTRNAITDYYRSAVHRREVVTDGVPELAVSDPTTDEDQAAEQALAGLALCVRPLLRLLPDDQAAAVELVDLGGRTQVDAARAAGISVSGMKSRVQRGRRGLEAAIAACCRLQLDVRGAVQDFHSHSGSDCRCLADA
jgi:RNA polymerase sigma-70 factor (ECF subfamily)